MLGWKVTAWELEGASGRCPLPAFPACSAGLHTELAGTRAPLPGASPHALRYWLVPEGQVRAVPHTPLAERTAGPGRHLSGGSERRPASPVSLRGARPTYLPDSSKAPEATQPHSRLHEGLWSQGRGRTQSGRGESSERGKAGAWDRVCAAGSAPRSARHSAGPALGALGKEGVLAAVIRGSKGNPVKVTPHTGPDFDFEAKDCQKLGLLRTPLSAPTPKPQRFAGCLLPRP